jgi:hypothetical protein
LFVHVVDEGAGERWAVDIVIRPPADSGDLNERMIEFVRAASPDLTVLPAGCLPATRLRSATTDRGSR